MNPVTIRIVAGVIRHILTAVGGAGLLSDDELYQIISAIVLLVGLGWSMYQKIQQQRKLLTAAASPLPVSEAMVDRMVSDGKAPPATLPRTSVPYVNTTS